MKQEQRRIVEVKVWALGENGWSDRLSAGYCWYTFPPGVSWTMGTKEGRESLKEFFSLLKGLEQLVQGGSQALPWQVVSHHLSYLFNSNYLFLNYLLQELPRWPSAPNLAPLQCVCVCVCVRTHVCMTMARMILKI